MARQDDTLPPEREKLVRQLRERYLAGTLDEVLIPEDANFEHLLDDLRAEEEPREAAASTELVVHERSA